MRLPRIRCRRRAFAVMCAVTLAAAACGHADVAHTRAESQTSSSASAAAPPPSVVAAATVAPASAVPGSASSASASSATARVTWSALGKFTPLWVHPSEPLLGTDPNHPATLALCVPGAVRISRDGGAAWTTVPTTGVAAALSAVGYNLPVPAHTEACNSAVVDPTHTGRVYAVFGVEFHRYGIPPSYAVAVYTTDAGKTWAAVPPPNGFNPGDFGGLHVTRTGAVQAIFGPPVGSSPSHHPAFAVAETIDGGEAWQPAALACPASRGPCLRWGPAPDGTGSCAMHAYPQPMELSTDGGRNWRPPYNTANLTNTCGASNEIVGVGVTRVLLIDSNTPLTGPMVVRVSDDDGHTWARVALPSLPAGTHQVPEIVQMLPSGTLLARLKSGAAYHLYLLAPGASAWCTTPGLTLTGSRIYWGTMQATDGRLFWLQQGAQAGESTLESISMKALNC